jgi:hypothetical protein
MFAWASPDARKKDAVAVARQSQFQQFQAGDCPIIAFGEAARDNRSII